MRRVIRRIVSSLATEISECTDGAEAVQRYAQVRPDWVLMDIEMKDLDGISAARQIKTDFPEARIVMVTNYDHPNLRAAARRAGAKEYVLKENLLELPKLLGGAMDS